MIARITKTTLLLIGTNLLACASSSSTKPQLRSPSHEIRKLALHDGIQATGISSNSFKGLDGNTLNIKIKEDTISQEQNERRVNSRDKSSSSSSGGGSSRSGGSSSSSLSSGGVGSESSSSSSSSSGGGGDGSVIESGGTSTVNTEVYSTSAAATVNSRSSSNYLDFIGGDSPATSILVTVIGGMMCLLFLFSIMTILSYQAYTASYRNNNNGNDDDERSIIPNENNKAEQLMQASLD